MSFIADYLPFLSKHLQGRKKSTGPLGWLWDNASAIVAAGAFISGIATYMALTEAPPFGSDPNTVIWLLNIDLIFLLLLIALIARRIVGVWSGRKRGLAGSHLHVRLVFTFSMLAAAPAIIMTIFSAVFFHFGVQTWFSQRVQTAIGESLAVAEAYLEEHKQVIRADALAMGNDIDRQAPLLLSNEEAFDRVMQTQSMLRNLSEAIVFESSGRVLARSGLTFTLEFEDVPAGSVEKARTGEVVIMTGGQDDRVRALLKLNNFVDTYLYVGRMVDPKVLSHLVATRQATKDYEDLQQRHSDLQIQVTMIFVVVGLVLLFVAIWFGLILARQLVGPIGTLITAVDRVRAGDLTARVPEQEQVQEFDFLARSFNRMTRQIEEQQTELLEANRQIDRRRHFTETVLAGVSSGVLGVNAKGVITLANASACDLLGYTEGDLRGQNIRVIIPEIKKLLAQADERFSRNIQGELSIEQKNKTRRNFLVRIGVELLSDQDTGMVITFDDMTELQSAQRKAAWSDVARRIAHEIKNPLTPIQLSAERLKRKYLSQIKDDPDVFVQCTDTIIRQVEDIGRMVNEFSSFARMPEPVMKTQDLPSLVEDTLFLHRQAHADIAFTFENTLAGDALLEFDSQQIRQALTNLVQNAVDSIHLTREQNPEALFKGSISVAILSGEAEEIVIAVSDNGLGLPEVEQLETLTEPYVTHKAKGTGLGLAIVKKIMEDHNGSLVMGEPEWLQARPGWRSLGGATVLLILPRRITGKNNI